MPKKSDYLLFWEEPILKYVLENDEIIMIFDEFHFVSEDFLIRFADPNYVPSYEDICFVKRIYLDLHCWSSGTSGSNLFKSIVGKIDFCTVIVDLSTFDEFLKFTSMIPTIKRGTNLMKYWEGAFEELTNEEDLIDIPLLIVFDNFDQLKQKIEKENSLVKCYPEHNGNQNVIKATKFIVDKFKSKRGFSNAEMKQEVKFNIAIDLPTKYGDFKMHHYSHKETIDSMTFNEHLAMVKGDISGSEANPVVCRIHSSCITGDIFGSCRCDCGEQLQNALRIVNKLNRGLVIYLHQEGRGIGLEAKLKAYKLQQEGLDTVEANLKLGFAEDERHFFVASEILKNLGVKKIQLLTNNPLKSEDIEKFGIEVSNTIPIEIESNDHNHEYLKTKMNKMRHKLTKL
eukprot:gene8624-571_t